MGHKPDSPGWLELISSGLKSVIDGLVLVGAGVLAVRQGLAERPAFLAAPKGAAGSGRSPTQSRAASEGADSEEPANLKIFGRRVDTVGKAE